MAEVTPTPPPAQGALFSGVMMAVLIFACVATLIGVALVAPVQLPVILYKVNLVCSGVLLGYIANEAFLHINNEIAQAIIILAVIHGLTGGL